MLPIKGWGRVINDKTNDGWPSDEVNKNEAKVFKHPTFLLVEIHEIQAPAYRKAQECH